MARSERGELGGAAARSAGFIETNDGARGGRSRAAWRPLTCPARGSSTFEVFFPPLKLFRWCFVSCFFSSSSPGWNSCPRLPRRQRSCATRSCAALLFALRVGRGNPTTRQENENDGRGGVTDDHLRRMRLSRPPRPTYSVSYLYSRVLYIAVRSLFIGEERHGGSTPTDSRPRGGDGEGARWASLAGEELSLPPPFPHHSLTHS